MGLYLTGAVASDGTFTNKSNSYTFSWFLSTDSSFLLFHNVRLILPDEQAVPGLDDVRSCHERSSHVCNPPRALAYESFRSSSGHTFSSWSFEPLTILGSLHFGKHAPRLHGLRHSRVDCDGDFLPRPLSSSGVSLDQIVQASRRLHFHSCGMLAFGPFAFTT